MKYNVILFAGMLLSASVGYAQVNDAVSNEQLEQSSQPSQQENVSDFNEGNGDETERIEVRRFDEKVWKEVVGTKDYSEEKPTNRKKRQNNNSSSGESSKGNKRVQPDDSDDTETESSASPLTRQLLTIVAYAAAIGLIGYILFIIIKNVSVKSNPNIIKANLSDHSAPIEDIKELEIDRLLREALASGNYRLAIRIYFLGMLKKLDEDGIILWKKDKTNRDYLAELFSKAHYFEEVRTLTLAYEQVWYGEHNLPVEAYEEIISSFKAIDQQLKASKPA